MFGSLTVTLQIKLGNPLVLKVTPACKTHGDYVLKFSLNEPVHPGSTPQTFTVSIPISFPYEMIKQPLLPITFKALKKTAGSRTNITLSGFVRIKNKKSKPESTSQPNVEAPATSNLDPVPDFTRQKPLSKNVTFRDFVKQRGLVVSKPVVFGKNSVTLQFEKKETGKILFELVIKSLKTEITAPVRIVLTVDKSPGTGVSATVDVKKVTEGDVIRMQVDLDFEAIADEEQGYLVGDDLIVRLEVYGFPASKWKPKRGSRLVDNSKEKTGYVGLTNQGATSSMNAMLQALFHIPAFRRLIYQMPTTGAEDPKKSIPYSCFSSPCLPDAHNGRRRPEEIDSPQSSEAVMPDATGRHVSLDKSAHCVFWLGRCADHDSA
jgi:hypothetical protein